MSKKDKTEPVVDDQTQTDGVMAPLDGVTVVEIDNWMAAPSAAAILADMGATVIKVEPLTGDPMRDKSRPPKLASDSANVDARKAYDYSFDVDNRGKHSIAVALDTDDGVSIVHKLVESADIFMCNLLGRRQRKFKLDPDTLLGLNPKLVHATLTGYGTDGPEAERPGYDVTAFFGRSGLYDSMRDGEDGVVPQARPAQGDHTTGLALVGGILAALRVAEKTGVGQAVETSLFEAAIWTQATDYAVTAIDEAPVRHRSRFQVLSPQLSRFPCGDGKWVVFNMPGNHTFAPFATALGREDWLEDERFAEASTRYRNMEAMVREVDETLAQRTRDEWGEIFDSHGVIWGPVLGLHEVPKDPQAIDIGVFPRIQSEEIGTYKTVRIPMRFSASEVGPKAASPKVGEHTVQTLSAAGFSDDEIGRMLEAGVVKAPEA